MKNVLRTAALFFASLTVSAYAGTVDVGSGSTGTELKTEISDILPFDKVYFGNLLEKTSKGMIDTDIPCTVLAGVENGRIFVHVVDMTYGAQRHRQWVDFETNIDGSELSSQPKTSAGELYRELSLQSVGDLNVQNLNIRAIEGGAIVTVSEQALGDKNLPKNSLICSIE